MACADGRRASPARSGSPAKSWTATGRSPAATQPNPARRLPPCCHRTPLADPHQLPRDLAHQNLHIIRTTLLYWTEGVRPTSPMHLATQLERRLSCTHIGWDCVWIEQDAWATLLEQMSKSLLRTVAAEELQCKSNCESPLESVKQTSKATRH